MNKYAFYKTIAQVAQSVVIRRLRVRSGFGSIPSRRLIMNYFLRSFSPFRQLSVSGERTYTSTDSPHRRLSLSRKKWGLVN